MNTTCDKFLFSVILSVYYKDKTNQLTEALDSVIEQTVKPAEIILVIDGLVSDELNELINNYESDLKNFHVIRNPVNMGHAVARQLALEATSHNLVALMDSDDISAPDRFEKQLQCFNSFPGLDVLGGQIQEFIGSPNNVISIRNVPLEDHEIKEYLKSRCPFNQVSVMFKKSSVLAAGGYLDWPFEEDYYLWIRMHMKMCNFKNLADTLVYVRVGDEMYLRRGGISYFLSEAKLQRYMMSQNIISYPRMMLNILLRFIVQILMPNKIRSFIFRWLFRKPIVKYA